ncbi:hypothetical protein [Brachyspira sp. SAP_772]|uniref:hypothetical protein n=1 Tax=Brachyspira sp. SAP_772 TaxID=2608385 RepID=UPI0012F4D247|nr:hypothetical protein [Brachyspira sp. SAP_772]
MQKEIVIRFIEVECWKCNEKYNIYYVMPDEKKFNNNLIFNNEVISKVKEFIKKNNLIFGDIKERYSNTRNEKYISFGCPKCDAICGDYYLKEIIFDTMYENKGCIDDIKITINI